MNIIPILFFATLIGAVVYSSMRMAWAFKLPVWLVGAVFLLLSLGFFFSMMYVMRNNLSDALSHFVHNVSIVGFGVLTIFILSLVLVDLLQLIAKMPPLNFGVVVLGFTALFSGLSLWNAHNTKVYHVDVEMPNLVTPLRLAQLSDIHIGHIWGKRTVDKLVTMVENEQVDAVVITGDMFDGRVRLNAEVLEPFKRLDIPIYFVEGNHDGYSGSTDIKTMLEANGITVLDNEMVDFNGLQIVGLDYLMPDRESVNTFHAPPAAVTMEEVLPTFDLDRGRASVLLHHNPVGVQYAAANGLNLYLAGHTHGGQMFPATLVARAIFPFNAGLYRYDDTTQVYVSQGSGTFGPPMRLGTESEITILNLVASK